MIILFSLLGLGVLSFFGDWLSFSFFGVLLICYLFSCMGSGLYVFTSGLVGDELSFSLVILSFWIILQCLLASLGFNNDSNFFVKFLFFGYAMLAGLVMSFFSSDVLSFYMWFEGVFVIIFLMVTG